MGGRFTAEEERALAIVAKARRDVVLQMFTGTSLQFNMGAKKAAKEMVGTAKKIKSVGGKASTIANGGSMGAKMKAGGGMANVPGIKQAIEDFIRQCSDIENIHDVAAAIGSEALSELIGEITPYVGVAVSTGKLAKAAKAVADDGTNLYRHSSYRGGFRPGDPELAAQAIRIIIERDLTRHSIDAGRHAVATGAKIGGLFADFGTGTTAAIGLANTLASLGLKLYALGLDIKDWRAGNRILQNPHSFGLDSFNQCPVLGCYLLTCADTSSVANFFLSEMGAPGWMDRIEELKKKQMDPLIKIAKSEINRSPLQLEGLRSDKGTHQDPTFFSKWKAKIVNKTNPSAKKMEGFGSKMTVTGVRG